MGATRMLWPALRRRIPTMVVAALVLAAGLGGGAAAGASTTAPHRTAASAGAISTVAGGVGGPAPATSVSLDLPCSVAYAAGQLEVAGGRVVRTVSLSSGLLATPAGTGSSGPLGNGGPATRASLTGCGVAADQHGNLVVADLGHQRVRVVAASTGTFYGKAMKAGHIYAIAGDGKLGFAGDGGPATAAELHNPAGVAVDGAGNVLIADFGNARVRVVAASTGTFYGKAMKAGDIYAIAGDGKLGFAGDGGPGTKAELHKPSGLAVDGTGNVLIADTGNKRVRVVAGRTGTFYGKAMTVGHIYTVAGDGTAGFSGDGGPATAGRLDSPEGVAADSAGNVLIADTKNDRVRVVAGSTGTFYGKAMTAGDIYTIAGNGDAAFSGNAGPATAAQLSSPEGVAADSAGNVLTADSANARIRAVAGSTGTFYGRPMTAGDIYAIAGDGRPGFSGDGGLAINAELDFPSDVAMDGAGNVLIADSGNARVRVVAGSSGTFYGQAMTVGHIYTVAGDGTAGYSGDGGPATAAELDQPAGVTVDGVGNVLIADSANNRIRVVAATTGKFYGKAMIAGDIYTIAGDGTAGYSGDGGRATAGKLSSPEGVAADGHGNLLIADTLNSRIRVVAARTGTFYGKAMTAGDIYTIAGNGTAGFSGDGGPATAAKYRFPIGVAVDSKGNVLIADTNNNRARVVAAATGTFYGKAMTAGDSYTIAGNGKLGFSGDGGRAAKAELANPDGVIANGAGNVLIADGGNARIREVTG